MAGFSGGGGSATVPGGATNQIQFNSSGAFSGSDRLSWDNTNIQLDISKPTTVTSDEAIGTLLFSASDGSGIVPGVKIEAKTDYGTIATNDLPSKLIISTTPDGSSTPTEAMRINQGQAVVIPNGAICIQGSNPGGDFGVGGTNEWSGIGIDYFPTAYDNMDGGRLIIRGDSTNTNRGTFVIHQNKNDNSAPLESVQIDKDGNFKTIGGNVYIISDSRVKENVAPLGSVISKLKQLNPVEFDWGDPIKNNDPARTSNHDFGFIAQEAEIIYPDMIYTGAVTNDDMPDNIKTMTYASMIPILTKAIQEQQQQIENLLARIVALES